MHSQKKGSTDNKNRITKLAPSSASTLFPIIEACCLFEAFVWLVNRRRMQRMMYIRFRPILRLECSSFLHSTIQAIYRYGQINTNRKLQFCHTIHFRGPICLTLHLNLIFTQYILSACIVSTTCTYLVYCRYFRRQFCCRPLQ